MAKQLDKLVISPTLHIAKYDNSKRWVARFKIEKNWVTKTTGCIDVNEARDKASKLELTYQIHHDSGVPINGKRFDKIAELAIKRMENALTTDTGKVSFNDYIGTIRKYHIPYFGKFNIAAIDIKKLTEFDIWRISELGRTPAKSTILTHNAAMMRVYDEAVINKWLTQTQVPTLANNGVSGDRRAAFSKDEFIKISYTAKQQILESSNKKTAMIREMLVDYITVAVNTGIRPGTEMDNIKWGDISVERNHDKIVFFIYVRKGKTTKHTGARKVVCNPDVIWAFEELIERFPDRKPNDILFRLRDGGTTLQLGRNFERILDGLKIKDSPRGERTLYSLRHSYITWQLLNKVNPQAIARQCGTSLQMLEQHYNHIVPEMFAAELSGVDLSDPTQEIAIAIPDKEYDKKVAARMAKWLSKFEIEYKKRGCI